MAARCLYLSLEEGDRLTRAKLEAAGFPRTALENIEIFYDWPRGAEGILQLHRVLDARPRVRHVGIDSLTRFRRIPDARVPAFQADYEAVASLHDVAKARPGLAIDVVHHTRKLRSDDPLDDISGTYGLSAGCDSYAILRHADDGAALFIGGRLWCRDEHQYQLRAARQRWELVGPFDPLTELQRATLEELRAAGGIGPTDAARAWSISKRGPPWCSHAVGQRPRRGGKFVAQKRLENRHLRSTWSDKLELISGSELARRIGVTPSAVIRVRNRGRIAYADPARKLYADPEVRAAFKVRSTLTAPAAATPAASAAASGGEPISRTWYDRRQRALALHAERELALLERRSLDAGETARAWICYLANVRTRLLAIPSRVVPLLPLAAQQKAAALIEAAIREALTELSQGHGRGLHSRR